MSDYSEMLGFLTTIWDKEEQEINSRQFRELSQLVGKKVLFCYGPPMRPDKIFEAIVLQVVEYAALYEIDGQKVWKPFIGGPCIYGIPTGDNPPSYLMRWHKNANGRLE